MQMAVDDAAGVEIPAPSDFRRWAAAVADAGEDQGGEVCVRIVGNQESAGLNRRYRGCPDPANVLSFPCEMPLSSGAEIEKPLGDIVIAAPVVAAEARTQGKRIIDHWAHLFIHGMLHLHGYDHLDEKDALRMESKEIEILDRLGFADPYRSADAASSCASSR